MKFSALYIILISFLLISCGSSTSNSASSELSKSNTLTAAGAPVSSVTWYQPPINITWQWQLLVSAPQTFINTSYNVDLYDIDLFDVSKSEIDALKLSGKKVICYFSAGSYENWRSDAADFDEAILGNPLDGWEGERWLDISSNDVLAIMKKRLDLAVTKGCDGVEPDNMDGYTNTPWFSINADDQLNYNKHIANEAHNRGLSVALKNDLDQIQTLEPYYDFAVNEQCFKFNECDLIKPFLDNNKPVLNAEYNVNNTPVLCSDANTRHIQTLILPLNLDDSSRVSCF